MAPLFSASEIKAPQNDPRLARCGVCGLHSGCKSPKMPVTGEGRDRVLVVAEAPGRTEDARNEQLIGPAGQTLRRYLREIEVDLDEDCWKTNAVICWPGPGKNPTPEQIEACRSNLLKTVRELKPRLILLLGSAATSSLVGWLWQKRVSALSQWAGWTIPCQRLNAWICPTYHPSYIMRCENQDDYTKGQQQNRVVPVMFRQHLRQAFELRGSPWKRLPEFEKRVRIELDAFAATMLVKTLTYSQREVPVAFDYETNMLKPDSEQVEVVACSMSNGEETIAFPILPETKEAVVDFLRSPVPKVAHNLKFEDRWSWKGMGTRVRNWHWCTMETAHVLDNRRGISGLEFQSFVRLGQDPFKSQTAEYLKGGSNTPNKIRRADMRDLLQRNGLDALLTWHLYQKQKEDLR